MNKKLITGLAVAALVSGLAAALPAMAQDQGHNDGNDNSHAMHDNNGKPPAWAPAYGERGGDGPWQGRGPGMASSTGSASAPWMGMRPGYGVVGIVSSVGSTSLIVQSRGFGRNSATTTYTVDATNATVYKNDATTTLSGISVGDNVFVQGTVSGSSVTATVIRDGPFPMMGSGPGPRWNGHSTTTLPFKGNGEPVVAGTVSSIGSTTLSITTSSGTSYTVGASAAVITKAGATSTLSSISVGDYVIVQGTVNGSSVSASTIIDQQARQNPPSGNIGGRGFGDGFFGAIGGFFRHLFGF